MPPLQNLKTVSWHFLLLLVDFFDLYETPLDQTDARLSIIHTEACSGAIEQRSTSAEPASRAFCMSDKPQS